MYAILSERQHTHTTFGKREPLDYNLVRIKQTGKHTAFMNATSQNTVTRNDILT